VPVIIVGGPTNEIVKKLPKHKKSPDVGDKNTVFSSSLWIEQEDAMSFEDNEEVGESSYCSSVAYLRFYTTDYFDGLGQCIRALQDF
jgi:glutamyl-tRNA synthetase